MTTRTVQTKQKASETYAHMHAINANVATTTL